MEEARPGPSGISIHATVAVTIQCAGNGHSSNSTSSDTPRRPRKRPRKPETWKREVAMSKRARGKSTSPRPPGKPFQRELPDHPAPASKNASSASLTPRKQAYWSLSMDWAAKNSKMPTSSASSARAASRDKDRTVALYILKDGPPTRTW